MSIAYKGYVQDIVHWYVYQCLCMEDTKMRPVPTKLFYYDVFLTDGSKAHWCCRADHSVVGPLLEVIISNKTIL